MSRRCRGHDHHSRSADGRRLVARRRPRIAWRPRPGDGGRERPAAEGPRRLVEDLHRCRQRGRKAARSDRYRSRRRCGHRLCRALAGATGDRAARGHHGHARTAQPAGNHRRASQLAPPLPPAGRHDAGAARGRTTVAAPERAAVVTPRATLRLQFHKGFTFADAEAVVPYIAALGISHLYASPITRARTGSLHGYDVTDPTEVNPGLGGEAALKRLV